MLVDQIEKNSEREALRSEIHDESALLRIHNIKSAFFDLYQRTHADGYLTRYLPLTESSLSVLCSKDWSNMNDREVWQSMDDALDDTEMLMLLRSLLPN